MATVSRGRPVKNPVELKCQGCQGKYNGNAPRVVRALKQVMGVSRSRQEATTPKLCWVCARLWLLAQQPDEDVLMLRRISMGDE